MSAAPGRSQASSHRSPQGEGPPVREQRSVRAAVAVAVGRTEIQDIAVPPTDASSGTLRVAITGVCAAFMAGPGIPLMSFMYGLSFERYRTLALLMVVAGGVTAAIDFIYAIITVLRHAGDVTKIYLICFAVSVVLPVILIKLLGLMGAVVSYLAIMALLLVLLIIEYAHIRQRIERDRNPYGA